MSYFIGLHNHTDASLRDAISRPHDMAKRLNAIDQKAIAITDHGNMCAIAIFDKELTKAGIKLIAGNEMYLALLGPDDTSTRDTAHITLIAMNMEGYHNLCKLHTLSWQRPAYFYNPRTGFDLLGQYNAGIICLSGCLGGVLLKPFNAGDIGRATSNLKSLKQIFGNRFYIELQDHHIPEDEASINWLIEQADKYKLQTVATCDAHYVNKEDWRPHDMIIACGMNQRVGDPNRTIAYRPEEFYLKSYAEMAERFEPHELANSQKIADLCEPLKLESKTFHIPMVDKKGLPALTDIARSGIIDRFGKSLEKLSQPYKDRFYYELKAIDKGGFTQYLLLMHDMYEFMKEKGIPYGPGRGSAAASIVCYALGITGVDPLEYDLLFERFINPERVSAPDIDCDISAERRGEVITYLKERWGNDKVAQIVTFGTLGAPAAIRDMARTLGKPLALADKLAKLVPKNGSLTTDREDRHYIDETLGSVKEFKKLYDSNSDAKIIIDAARDVEGIIKNASVHAAGIVIADKPIVEYAPLLTTSPKKDAENQERPLSVAFAMNELEHLGLIKFDLLGLQSLDIIKHTVEWIKRDKVVKQNFDIEHIPLDDPKTYSLLGLGLTAGVFQFESPGMAGWLRKLKPDSIDDLIAMVALYRPGPMQFIEKYVDRKLGKAEVEYPHKVLKSVLGPTYGIAVYQEQLMQIGVVIAGWSLSRADQLRKVIGKKIIDKIEQEGIEFTRDAVKNGYNKDWAQKLFDEFIAPAGRYSFNKGHATVYGLLAYQTAYLKANFPLHYFAALLANVAASTKADKADKTASYISDARAMGIAILPPDIHESGLNFTPVFESSSIRFGLLAIKNVGDKAVQLMIKEKEKHGPYKNLFDFVERTTSRLVTSRTIESLVLAGALDTLPGTREEKLASVSVACTRNAMLQEDRKRTLAGGKPVNRKVPIPEARLIEYTGEAVNLLARERDLLGTYLSGHPFNDVADEAASVSSVDLQGLRDLGGGTSATICGIVSGVNKITTKKKQKMYTITVEDDKCSQEVIIFPQKATDFDEEKWLDQPIVIFGRLEDDEDEESASLKFILDKFHALSAAPIRRRTETRTRVEHKSLGVSHSSTEKRDINRIYLTYENYHQMIAAAKAPCSFLLPNGQELICANNR